MKTFMSIFTDLLIWLMIAVSIWMTYDIVVSETRVEYTIKGE